MISCAKALSAAYQPISALMISDKIYEAMIVESGKLGSFGHGFTYGGHPVSCAVALETLKIYEEREVLGHVRKMSPLMQNGLKALEDHPLVGNARGVGLIAGVEVMKDKNIAHAVCARAQSRHAGAGQVPGIRPDRARDRRPHRLHPAADHQRGRNRRDARRVPQGAGRGVDGAQSAVVHANCGDIKPMPRRARLAYPPPQPSPQGGGSASRGWRDFVKA